MAEKILDKLYNAANQRTNDNCEGCSIDDPSQINHSCLMDTTYDRLNNHICELFENELSCRELLDLVKYFREHIISTIVTLVDNRQQQQRRNDRETDNREAHPIFF